mgnify:CR=1 FL=1
MHIALTNAKVLTPDGFLTGKTVVVEEGTIKSICDHVPFGASIRDLSGQMLVPGLVDLQVNGGGGCLFNADPSVQTVTTIARAHRRHGTTGLLPTLVSDDLSVIEAGIQAVDKAIDQGVPGVLGIHIEGPFLATSRKGIHQADKLLELADSHLALLSSLKRGRTLVTLAPECATPELISRLAASGVVVSLGHSNADYATARLALEAGATGFTHLFNAMSQLQSRDPGMVGAAFESDTAYAGIIVDGQHVHPASVTAGLKAMGANRLHLVSDAMATAGSDIVEFDLQGTTIFKTGDRLHDRSGTLAGSVLTLMRGVKELVCQTGVSLDLAIGMASRVPANFIGLGKVLGSIASGQKADLVAIDSSLAVHSTWIDGLEEQVYQAT